MTSMVGANELLNFIKTNNLSVTNSKISKVNPSNESCIEGNPVGESRYEVKPNFLSLTGGAWYVPDELLSDFYKIIRRLILQDALISIVEVRTDIFKYFLDLDFVSDIAITIDIVKKVSKLIHICIKENIKEDQYANSIQQYVYTAKPRMLDSGKVKTGVHIYYPDVHISSESAQELRKRIIVNLISKMPELESLKWESVIDPSVYSGSGLRLAHQPKLKKCKCVKLNGECQNGCHFGVINENSIYLPSFQISSVDEISDLEKLKGNLRQSLSLTQIRINNKSLKQNFSLRERCSITNDLKGDKIDQDLSKQMYENLDTKNSSSVKRKDTNFYADNSQILSYDIQQKIETFIKKSWKQYDNLQIRNVKKITYKAPNRKDTYVKYYVNTTSRYCMNISREHRSNTIYFIIYISGNSIKVSQRCHCTCDTTHYNATILCKNYSSKSIDIKSNTDLYKVLITSSNKNNGNSDYVSTVAYSWNIDMTADVQNRNEIYNRLTKAPMASRPIDIQQNTKDENNEDSQNSMFDISVLDSLINNTIPDNFLSNRIKMNRN